MILLGSTGSIGVQALQIIKSQNLNIEVLSAGENIDLLNAQIAEFRPKIVVIKDSAKKDLVRGAKVVLCGDCGIIKALNIAESSLVLNALVGFSGVRPSLEAIRLGKRLALANKESLVVAGFLIDSAELARIIPVDSEHFALKELLSNSVLGMQFRTKNAESSLDSADSQNLNQNNPRVSANLESRPLRGAKNRIQGRSSASADFLLEAEKRGSPPKSEKAELFGAQGERGGGCSPFCEKESNELSRENSVRVAESKKISGLPRRFCESARNDGAESPQDEFATRIKKMFITASGGAFRDLPLSEIPHQSAESALRHPNWAMGRKITIDSATMINKVFEILEARFLFNTQNIDAVIERSSTIHAIIQMQNNALLAHFSANDMRLPIAHALLGAKAQNLAFIKELDLLDLNVRFEHIDCARYPLWALKDEVLKNPRLGAIINAANDILVERFLQNQICFGDISRGIFAVLDKFGAESIKNIDEILELNAKIKDFLSQFKGFRH